MRGWFRPKEAAEYCGVSERTLRHWLKCDGLQYSKLRGTVLINKDTLDSFLESFSVSENQHDIVERVVNDVIQGL